jgi:hypothetical protein
MFPAVLAEVRRIVRELDPGLLSGADAAVLMEQFDELENLAAGAKALLAARAVETHQWRHEGDRSPEHWLARKTGAYVGAARDLLDTAERLKDLPATEQALRDGALSVQQASVVAKGASVDPAAEQQLLDTAADSSLRELERQADRVIAAKRTADQEREREDQIRRNRSLQVVDLPDGSAELRARGNKVDVAKLRARLQPWIDEQFKQARTEDRHEPVEAYAFDALVAMAAAEAGPGTGKSPAKVLVRVDLSALRRGTTMPGEVCEIAGYGAIPVSEVLKVMPDALVAIVCTHGKPVNVTHLGRKFTAAGPISRTSSSSGRSTSRASCGATSVRSPTTPTSAAGSPVATPATRPSCTRRGSGSPRCACTIGASRTRGSFG